MGKINVLSFAVANLIAAGEVVDRPASVIKELMENAVDAGSTRVTVEIQNGGVTFMRVTDNGCGMEPDDLPVAIRRHATSKIKNAQDLDGIATLGFRGEALAAIASVSDLRILSKTKGAAFGAMLESHAGNILSVTEQGCSDGTSVIVENLFENVPARRKFLKKDMTESMAVTANVEKVALSHPEVAVRLLVDGNVRLETAGDGNLQNTVYAVFGKEFASRIIEIDSESDGIRVHGIIGRTDNFRANRNYENFFINGRYVKSKTIAAALEQAYTSYMPPEKFPTCVLFLDVNPTRVDVNVHPAKLEIKFSNEKPVFEAVYYTVRTALEQNVTRPAMTLDLSGRKKSFQTAGRMSDATEPVRDGRPESLARRQLSYDLEGRTQPQPQDRMTAAEYRSLFAAAPTKKNAPTLLEENVPFSVGSRGNVPVVTQNESIPVAPHAEDTQNTVQNAPRPAFSSPATPSSSVRAPLGRTDVYQGSKPPAPTETERTPAVSVPTCTTDETRGQAPTQTQPFARLETNPSETAQNTAKIPPVDGWNAENTSVQAPEYRIVGEVFNSYVIVETGDKMLLIDKHAAHERILFEELKKGMYREAVCSQLLMVPVDVMMTGGEVESLQRYEEELSRVGFSVRFARNTVSVDAIPEEIDASAVPEMLETMAGRILNETGNVKITRDTLFEKALYQAACKAAIKAGRAYADEHIEWIVKKLMECPDITFCPHGRPVAVELTHHALDRQFDRTGF